MMKLAQMFVVHFEAKTITIELGYHGLRRDQDHDRRPLEIVGKANADWEGPDVLFRFTCRPATADLMPDGSEYDSIPMHLLWKALQSMPDIEIYDNAYLHIDLMIPPSIQMCCVDLSFDGLVFHVERRRGVRFPPSSFPLVRNFYISFDDILPDDPSDFNDILGDVHRMPCLMNLCIENFSQDPELPPAWAFQLGDIPELEIRRFQMTDEAIEELVKGITQSATMHELKLHETTHQGVSSLVKFARSLRRLPRSLHSVTMTDLEIQSTTEQEQNTASHQRELFASFLMGIKENMNITEFDVSEARKFGRTVEVPHDIKAEIDHLVKLNAAGRRLLVDLPMILPSLIPHVLSRANGVYPHNGVYFLLREHANLRTSVARYANNGDGSNSISPHVVENHGNADEPDESLASMLPHKRQRLN